MPSQFGLAIAINHHLASKWLNKLLYKTGFSANYNEVRTLQSQGHSKTSSNQAFERVKLL